MLANGAYEQRIQHNHIPKPKTTQGFESRSMQSVEWLSERQLNR